MINYDELFEQMSRLSVKLNDKNAWKEAKKEKASEVNKPAESSNGNKKYGAAIFWRLAAIALIVVLCIGVYKDYCKARNITVRYRHFINKREDMEIVYDYHIKDGILSGLEVTYNGEVIRSDNY